LTAHHLVPSHNCAERLPTAMQNEVLGHDTELSRVVTPEPSITRHVRPFQRSARERPVPKFEPAATQNVPPTQDAADR